MATSTSTIQQTLKAALDFSLSHLEGLDQRPVSSTVDLQTLRRRLAKPLEYGSRDPAEVISDLVGDVEGGILGSAGGRFFGWVIGGSLPAALAADWLTAAWDQNAALYACGPAAAIAEEVAGNWLKELLDLPERASFALTSGCQMAHVTCLAAARHSLLRRKGWDTERKGLQGAPRIRVLSSTERHGSIDRAVRLLGLGSDCVVDLPVDAEGNLSEAALDQALREDKHLPTIVLLQAGDLNMGAYDRFQTLIPLARKNDAWVHIDGAFGLWAAASPLRKHLTEGVSQADSWATDGHKWLNVPYDCGYAFIADSEAHRSSLSHRAPYLTHDASARDQMDWNPEWSRRARGFPTYAAIRQLGKRGVTELVERCCRHALSLTTSLGALPGVEVLSQPIVNQGLVRFLDPSAGASEADHDQRTDDVIAEVLSAGEAFFGGTTWRGRRAMRISVCNWQTSESHVAQATNAIKQALDRLAPVDYTI